MIYLLVTKETHPHDLCTRLLPSHSIIYQHLRKNSIKFVEFDQFFLMAYYYYKSKCYSLDDYLKQLP